MIPVLALDAIATIGGLIIPPVFDFVKKKFIKAENDTPERTMGTLATTAPEHLAKYVEALSKYKEAEVKHFNRDVIGIPSMWVVNIRAAIRPIVVCVGLGFFFFDIASPLAQALFSKAVESGADQAALFELDAGTRLFFESVIASWFGSRVFQSK